MKKLHILFLILCSLSLNWNKVSAQNDFEIAKNVDIFVSILKELNAKYAEEVNPTTLVTDAINGMLSELDPYSVYYPESQIEDYKLMTTGQYGGIGALIQQRDEKVMIYSVYENTPAHKSGLRPGDYILKVNENVTTGKKSDDVSALLKGQPGTIITLEVERPSTGKTMNINVKREEIKFPSVHYYGMLRDEVGYIRLDQFTEKAGAEVKEAFLLLKEEGMQYLILDLRNNGGGLLHEAVNIMNIFVDANVKIAETKGKIKEQNNVFKTRGQAVDKDIPVVVLVNESSASASEIVAGAFQDLDRGVIVGKKTFGKGLVQNVLPLSYNTSFKITVSKYYIPSGRCVQNIDYFSKDTNAIDRKEIPDSLATKFYTKKGRTVYDKGGVEPDIFTKDTAGSNILLAIVINHLAFDFANQYREQHDSIAPPKTFEVTDEIYAQFLDFVKKSDFEYDTETNFILEELKTAAKEEKYFEAIATLYQQMEAQIEKEKIADMGKYKDQIAAYLGAEIVSRYYYQKGSTLYNLNDDTDIETALKVLLDKKLYQSILSKK